MRYINNAAVVLGVKVETLRRARAMPEHAHLFKSGRCDDVKLKKLLPELLKIEATAEEGKEYWQTLKTKNDALMSELELEEMKKKYFLKEDVEKHLQAIAIAQKALLKSKLCAELPQQILGMSVPEIAVKMAQVLDDVCNLMTTLKL
jgi:hypothetical protein